MRSSVLVILVLVGILLLAGLGFWFVQQHNIQEALHSSPAAQALQADKQVEAYTDMGGNQVIISDYVGSVMVVNSWASWCPFCAAELQELAAAAKDYEEEGVVVLAINRAENAATAERFIATTPGLTSVKLILDPTDKYYKSIVGYTMPETVVYDEKGNVIFHKRGPTTKTEITQYIEQALAAQAD